MATPVKGKKQPKQRAKGDATALSMPMPYKPPTPAERLSGTMEMSAREAAMNHPQTQRLKTKMHADMMKVAKKHGFSGMPMTRNVRSY